MLLAKYTIESVKLFAGYEHIQFANPSHPLTVGAQIPNSGGGYSLGTVNNGAFTNNKVLQVFWAGAKYAVRPDIDLMAAYYHESQNSFQGNGCSNDTFAACSGQLDAVSVVADYRFAKRFDVYAGAMIDDPQAPWGGFKYSGVGREYGRYGIDAFLETRAILES